MTDKCKECSKPYKLDELGLCWSCYQQLITYPTHDTKKTLERLLEKIK